MIFKKHHNILFVTSKIEDKNMSLIRGNPQQAFENRKRFLIKFGINLNQTVEVKYMHGNKVIKATQTSYGQKLREADGIITNKPNLYLMIKGADCHQIAFYDPKNKAIALVHAGWRGLEKEIISNTIKKLAVYFNTLPKDLIVEFGPSIGPCCYRMDIWYEAEKQLKSMKVPSKNIYNPRICTYHTNQYFSHKRAVDYNQDDFRFVTILGMKRL